MVGHFGCSSIGNSLKESLKFYSTGQIIFGRDIIILIKRTLDWELIRQKNQTQINKDNIRKNRNLVDLDYNIRDEVLLTNHAI